ncbi:transcriptional regulator [Ameyamaea chiangmaiensis NBRC 103196]|uniref:GntR family transcriptional regulator n=1 Tax=Ameyamaea chiangmaiensis TaxID=442969 RepID=A0A850P9I1_9PROT|nr:GntR family transcriptional regulator [Ameyamaea chiangmaiensis]MBS4075091.1 GntR family transcriptional regulator [Ameyamaea chiangmaiensis]NVN40558.1 GntR family transcriptional regulator [Ameyamaea chiangmaiensis]GBQ65500.1 transcriptional regulator [Ameyamaea chiangmaiensis NBRC 103196]
MSETKSSLTGEELYAALRRDMIDSRTPGGTVLQEEDIARRYGVSRTPVREALQRLHQDNLIGRRGRFYVVALPSHDRIRDIYEFREAIEAASVMLCCDRATDLEIETIAALLREQENAAVIQNFYDYERLDTLFHLAIADGARNEVLRSQLALSYDELWFSRVGNLISIVNYSVAATLGGHQRIVDALRRRERDVARAEMISHLRSAIAVSERALPQKRRKNSSKIEQS